MYAGRVTTTRAGVRWARGLAVALVTVPGVLVAQLGVAGAVPSLRATVVVCAVVAAVAWAVPTRTAVSTALVAGTAQLAGHVVLALAAPQTQARDGCLSVVGRGADLGVRYAVDRSGACPPGELSVAPTLAAVVAAVAAAALVLLGHAVLAALTGVLVVALAAAVEIVRELADAVRPALTLLLDVRVLPAGRPTPPLREPLPLTDRRQPGRVLRRGPPVAPAAV
jgi:hypothetical protein